MELDYYDGYFYYQGELVDIDADNIVWKDEEDPDYGEESMNEDVVISEK